MKLCPLCDQPAVSDHHIVPRSEGGTDEPRNLVKLCQKCHDEVEGIPFTPDLIEKIRREKLGAKATSHEKYWWLHKEEGVIFIGIEVPGRKDLIHYDVLFPYGSQFALPLEDENPEITVGKPLKRAETPVSTLEKPVAINNPMQSLSGIYATRNRNKRGRPQRIIPDEERRILETGGQTLEEKAKLLGVHKSTVLRRLKELQTTYDATRS